MTEDRPVSVTFTIKAKLSNKEKCEQQHIVWYSDDASESDINEKHEAFVDKMFSKLKKLEELEEA